MELRVYDCPHCGAPLPPSGLDATVQCTSCGKQTTLESGSDAVRREEKSRGEAEALFARLGQPPRWAQRVAARLVDWRLWIVGFPFLVGILVKIGTQPRAWIEEGYEHFFHARMLHVMSPVVGWLSTSVFIVATILGLLIWSLLGERVDARRDLQAMLAAKPPRTEGGAARCRKCDAPLEVTAGTLGTRCPYCGADNLLVLPTSWIARARKSDVELRLTTKLPWPRALVPGRPGMECT
jgi:DNA-directed RNA polymerase subunit RPC12/RpoP